MSININNNISLDYIPMEKFKTTSISVFLHTPLTREYASYNAVLPYVLNAGCGMCPTAGDIERYLENLYGASAVMSISKTGNDHILLFNFEAISDKYAVNDEPLSHDLLVLALDLIFNPVTEGKAFRTDVFNTEKKNAIARLESIRNNKRAYAQHRVVSEACPDDTYSISRYGTRDGLDALTNEALYAHYKQLIKSSKISIIITGDTDIKSAQNTIGEYISDIDFENAVMPSSSIITKSTPLKTVHEQLDVTQGKLAMLFTTDVEATGRDKNVMRLAVSVFGSGAHSKLFLNVREKLSLCYYAAASYDRYKGIVVVDAGIEFDKFQSAYDEILVQLNELKIGNVTDDEFNAAKASLINSFTTLYDDQYSMASFVLQRQLTGEDVTIESNIKEIMSVTKDEIIAIANKLRLDTVYFLEGKN